VLSPRDLTPAERGFTMVELVIALVLAGVVLGVAVFGITSLLGSSSKGQVDRRNAADIADALERFERDMRAAESDRVDGTMIRDELRASVLWGRTRTSSGSVTTIKGATVCDTPSEQSTQYCLDEDITIAQPGEVWFRADVDATNNGRECVSWRVIAGELWRRVTANAATCRTGAVGATLSNERVLSAPPSGAGNIAGTSASFVFLTRYNPVAFAAPINSIVDVDQCQSFTYPPGTTLTNRRRGYITNVTLDLAAWTTGGNAANADTAARSRLTTSATIMSRATDDYNYATGCAQ
jgi:prepilin-type N-terminal cleavage/methylation domain-containing protein